MFRYWQLQTATNTSKYLTLSLRSLPAIVIKYPVLPLEGVNMCRMSCQSTRWLGDSLSYPGWNCPEKFQQLNIVNFLELITSSSLPEHRGWLWWSQCTEATHKICTLSKLTACFRWCRSTRGPSSSGWAGSCQEEPRGQVSWRWSEDDLTSLSLSGIFFVLPCIESYQKVDLRTITLGVPPQEVIEKD